MRAVQIIAGDRSITNLSPSSLNIGGRIVKNMCIAGSGIYKYHRREAPLFGLDETFLPGDQEYFYMYRPPEVLDRNKKLFARVPIITGRHVIVTPNNAKELSVGMVGDSVESEVSADDGELYLYTTGTIVAGDGIEAYEKYGQLSVGYTPQCEWRRGTHRGTRYDAVLLNFSDVNHLLICKEARGGPQCSIMDSISSYEDDNKQDGGARVFSLFKKKPPVMAGDARVPILLESIVAGADPAIQVKAVKEITDKVTLAGDKKTEWDSYMTELSECKGFSADDKTEAIKIVKEFYIQNFAGDTKDDVKKDDTKKKDDDKKDGDKDDTKKDDDKKDGDKDDTKKTDDASVPGDQKFDERFSALEKTIGQLTQVVGGLISAGVLPKAAGDSGAEPPKDDDTKAGAATTTLAGDQGSSKSSPIEEFMASIRS